MVVKKVIVQWKKSSADKGIHDKHDRGYKFLLSSRRMFLQLLNTFVKQGWVEEIDEKDMMLINKSFILQDFKDKEADIVYRIKIKGQEVIFYVLLELQSSVDYQMPYRLLQYMLEIWREYLKDIDANVAEAKEFKLPIIVPIVLYNGSNRWTACESYKEYLRNSDMFGEYAVDFKYILLNVNGYPDEELLELSNLISMVFLIDKTKDFQQMMETLKRMIEPLKKVSPEEFLMFKHWLMNIATSGMSQEQKKEVEESVEDSEEVESMLYNLERAITNEFKKYESKLEEVRLEEKIQVAKNLLQMGMDILTVVKATGLTEEQIKKVKEELH
jgi:predicted transposase/invertase (TIGR01784 family)